MNRRQSQDNQRIDSYAGISRRWFQYGHFGIVIWKVLHRSQLHLLLGLGCRWRRLLGRHPSTLSNYGSIRVRFRIRSRNAPNSSSSFESTCKWSKYAIGLAGRRIAVHFRCCKSNSSQFDCDAWLVIAALHGKQPRDVVRHHSNSHFLHRPFFCFLSGCLSFLSFSLSLFLSFFCFVSSFFPIANVAIFEERKLTLNSAPISRRLHTQCQHSNGNWQQTELNKQINEREKEKKDSHSNNFRRHLSKLGSISNSGPARWSSWPQCQNPALETLEKEKKNPTYFVGVAVLFLLFSYLSCHEFRKRKYAQRPLSSRSRRNHNFINCADHT